LRGLGRERRHWFEFPRRLAECLGAQAHTVDLPGMGERRGEPDRYSVADIARDVRQRLGEHARESPWGVLGVSLGGMVAISLAAQWPSGVSHVVAVNSSSRLSSTRERLRPAALAQLFRALVWLAPEARERCLYALTTNSPEQDVVRWAMQAAEFGLDQPARGGALVCQLVAGARFFPRAIVQPVLVLSGAGDRLVSPACSLALARHLGAAHKLHPTAGHDLPLEDPDWVLEQMRVWLAWITAPTGD
jgi:pimeloyl-ACP methyl ester carboxylesterase